MFKPMEPLNLLKMRAKTINEDIRDILRPKSEEEIEKALKSLYKIKNKHEATRHLSAAIYANSILYAKYALKHGAEIFDQFDGETGKSSGNLWIAFNTFKQTNSQELIIKLLKTPQFKWAYNKNGDFRYNVLNKALYLGMTEVILYLLENFENHYPEVFKTFYKQEEPFMTSYWTGYEGALFLLKKWLKDNKLQESLEN